MPTRKSDYRADIDGLRAVAVVPVVLFHACVPGFSGGFVGVDIFFVISGYLITGIVAREIAAGQFSLAEFYERRARRIFPALFVMMAVSFVCAALILMPRAFNEFAKSVVASTFFVSNLFFWRTNSNYFAGPTEMMPMLHTWSLSVEEQFYVVFPLMLLCLARWRRRAVQYGVWVCFLASMALSVWGVANAPTATFFLAPTRGWELMVGALLALNPLRAGVLPARFVEGMGLAGGALIVWSVVAYDAYTAFPGLAALGPCLGAALIIAAGGAGARGAAAILAMAPMRFIGKISYSWYLWHWPMLVFAKHAAIGRGLGPVEVGGVLLGSFALAALSWRYVEQPLRRSRPRWQVVGGSAVAMGLATALGVSVVMDQGAPSRFPGLDAVAATATPSTPEWDAFDYRGCFVLEAADWAEKDCFLRADRPDAPNALIWGDSHAGHLLYGLMHEAANFPLDLVAYTGAACPPIVGYSQPSNPRCAGIVGRIAEVIELVEAETVLMAANWDSYMRSHKLSADEIGHTVSWLEKRGVSVVIVSQGPTFGFHHPDEFFFASHGADLSTRPFYSESTVQSRYGDLLRAASGPQVLVLEPGMTLCEGFHCMFRVDGEYLFADSAHLSAAGSMLLAHEILDGWRPELDLAESSNPPR